MSQSFCSWRKRISGSFSSQPKQNLRHRKKWILMWLPDKNCSTREGEQWRDPIHLLSCLFMWNNSPVSRNTHSYNVITFNFFRHGLFIYTSDTDRKHTLRWPCGRDHWVWIPGIPHGSEWGREIRCRLEFIHLHSIFSSITFWTDKKGVIPSWDARTSAHCGIHAF